VNPKELDRITGLDDDNHMNATETNDLTIPSDVMADAQLVAECVASGKPIPADVARRVHEHAEQIRQETLAKHGLLDIGVPAIREFRGELPQP